MRPPHDPQRRAPDPPRGRSLSASPRNATAAALLKGGTAERANPYRSKPPAFRAPTPRQPPARDFSSRAASTPRTCSPRTGGSTRDSGYAPHAFADGLLVHGNLKAESEDSPWSVRSFAAVGRPRRPRGSLSFRSHEPLELLPDLPFVSEPVLGPRRRALFRRRWTRVSIATGLDVATRSAGHTPCSIRCTAAARWISAMTRSDSTARRLAELAAAPLGVALSWSTLRIPGRRASTAASARSAFGR